MKLYFKRRKSNCDAVCEYTENEFIIKKGSKICLNSCDFKMSKLAESERNNKENFDGNILKKDISFKSASTAAQFVAGSSVNGLKYWKTKDGEPLKDIKKRSN